MKKLANKIFPMLFPDCRNLVRKHLKDCATILDMGCGMDSVLKYVPWGYKTGIDVFVPYINNMKDKISPIHNKYIIGDIRTIELADKSYDAVTLFDVVEHMVKPEAVKVIGKAERVARKKVIIITTNGFIPLKELDNNPFQTHKSGWAVKYFRDNGYKVYGLLGLKCLRGERGITKIKWVFGAEILSGITQWVTYFIPQLSFELYAVKEL